MLTTITGKDTLTLYDRVFTDFADDDVSAISLPNELAALKTGKNRNTIYAKNETGNNGELVIRLVRGSSDDIFLNGKLNSMRSDFPNFTLVSGQFVKKVGDGAGNVVNDVYDLIGGVFSKMVEAKENVSGDTTQSISIYTIRFAVVERSLM